ncbi:MAG: RsmD family RNA methyltransferase [Bacteroidales bacterium]
MRIISGKYKGRLIKPPQGFRARPTTDYARESLFNILANRYNFDELDVLDLFSGTGSITYEFASRDARSVELVELNRTNYRFIAATLRELKLENVTSYNTDVRIYLRKSQRRFDLVFADPPYDLSWLNEIPQMVMNSGILKTGGVFIMEHPGKMSFNDKEGFKEHRYYGSVNFSFFSFD